jgi:hypothetical protein
MLALNRPLGAGTATTPELTSIVVSGQRKTRTNGKHPAPLAPATRPLLEN